MRNQPRNSFDHQGTWSNGNSSVDLFISRKQLSDSRFENKYSLQDARTTESFLQVFGKPTQIYRYLGTHNRSPPVFLHRTLSYMKCRRSRKWATFRTMEALTIDSIAERLSNELNEKTPNDLPDLTINLTSFTDPTIYESAKPSTISVQASIISVFRKPITAYRRHPKTPQFEKKRVAVGIWDIPVNAEMKAKNRNHVLHVDKTAFYSSNSTFDKSSLILIAHPKQFFPSPTKNGSPSSADSETPKRRRKQEFNVIYRAEVVIFRSGEPCSLIPGDYEVSFSKRACSRSFNFSPEDEWDEGYEENIDYNSEESGDSSPTITIKVAWNALNSGKGAKKGLRSPSKKHVIPIIPVIVQPIQDVVCVSESKEEWVKIVYRFFYNSIDAQTTIGRSNFSCPWCFLNCISFKPLKMHLIHCHNRFNFKMTTEINGAKYEARIDVSPNEAFDGSYAGNPHHLVQPELGLFFARNGPTRRNSVTCVLVNKKGMDFRSEEYDSELEDGEAFITQGHDRLYYHTKTSLPIRPQDMDYDSESENDPLWMRTKTQLMIDEFTDVNEGEKEVMKLWNLLIMKYGFNADVQIPEACRVFINEYSTEISKKNIRYNFILHLNCLYDFGLLDANQMKIVIDQLNEVCSSK